MDIVNKNEISLMEHYSEYGKNLFLKTFVNDFWEKLFLSIGGTLVYYATNLFIYFEPLYGFAGLIYMCLIADLMLAVLVLKKKQEKISEVRTGDSFFKFTAYTIGLIMAHQLREVMFPSINVVYGVMVFICYAEYKSIDKKIRVLTGTTIFGFITKRFEFIISKLKIKK
jgi:hypothetical protein